ncbi:MAG: 3-oxo-5-alpha-steroid 4-dehydrogenase, partial [Polyangiaceae bacterium]|nr:3-oxo-5-alpha-steroid 4-dehydrogenase [Polyangiaceae bacterium]
FAIVLITAIAALFVTTPSGHFADSRFGIALDPRLGWFLMELPAPVAFFVAYFRGPNRFEWFPLFTLFVFTCHYANRGFVMPARMRVPKGQRSSFGLAVVLVGWLVTSLHGYLNATWVTTFHPEPGVSWFTDPRFLIGVMMYYAGFFGNLHADHVLRCLRTKDEVRRGERVYRIPEGGLFRYVTNASYLTELVLWAGFAIFTWSLPGLFIFAISAANLIPRAIQTHRWYHEKFPDYPKDRRVLIPFVF